MGMPELPPRRTLSDGNINRDSIVVEKLYGLLYEHYSPTIRNEVSCFFKDVDGKKKIEIIDSSTITLLTELFKGAGRNCLNGAKKGGLKIHTNLPLGGFVTSLVYFSSASGNDKYFLGQLPIKGNTIYLHDKGYVNYKKGEEIIGKEAYFVTRLKKKRQI